MSEEIKLNDEDPICLDDACKAYLDTGWECTACGKDWIEWYYPQNISTKESLKE